MSVEWMNKEYKWMREYIREIPDFPKEGILFYDITPLLQQGGMLPHVVAAMITAHRLSVDIVRDGYEDVIAAPEARGFILGAALATQLYHGFVPFRKAGKLPYTTLSKGYELEYGWAEVQMHTDAIKPGQKVLLVDDVLATGGTMKACCELVEGAGGVVHGCCFLMELEALKGREKLNGYKVSSVFKY